MKTEQIILLNTIDSPKYFNWLVFLKKDKYQIKTIDRVTTEAGITHFYVGQVYVVHRASPKESTPIVIIFMKKYDLKKTFCWLDANTFLEEHMMIMNQVKAKHVGPFILKKASLIKIVSYWKEPTKLASENLESRLQ